MGEARRAVGRVLRGAGVWFHAAMLAALIAAPAGCTDKKRADVALPGAGGTAGHGSSGAAGAGNEAATGTGVPDGVAGANGTAGAASGGSTGAGGSSSSTSLTGSGGFFAGSGGADFGSGSGGYPGTGGYFEGSGGADFGSGGYFGSGGHDFGSGGRDYGTGGQDYGTGGQDYGTGGYIGSGGYDFGSGGYYGAGGVIGSGGSDYGSGGYVGSGGHAWASASTLVTPRGLFTANTGTANLVLCPAGGSDGTPATEDALRAALTRKWLSCLYTFRGDEDGDALGTQGAGIEVKSDGRYWHLARDGAGKLAGSTGVDSEGTVTFGVSDLGAAQATFRSDLNQILVATPVLTAHPTVLIIRTATAEHRYIPADGP